MGTNQSIPATANKIQIPKPLDNIYPPNDEQTFLFNVDYEAYKENKKFSIFAFAVANRMWLQFNQFWANNKSVRSNNKIIVWSNSTTLDCSRMYSYLRRLVDKFDEPIVIVCYDYPGYGTSKSQELYEYGFDYVDAISALIHVSHYLHNKIVVPNENMYYIGQEVGAKVVIDSAVEDYEMSKSPLMLIAPEDCLLKRFCYPISSAADYEKFIPTDDIKKLNNPIKIVQYRSHLEPLHLCAAQQVITLLKYPTEPVWIRDDNEFSDMWPFDKTDAKYTVVNSENIIFYIESTVYKNFVNVTHSYFRSEADTERSLLAEKYKLECQESAKNLAK
jgi:hypothetical protein